MKSSIVAEAGELFEYTQRMRRDFHSHPELGFKEFRTSGIVAQELSELGLEVSKGIGKTGVVAILEGAYPGPVVMLRFDMDALPILEQTNASYASQNAGVMHACGHDSHTAVGLSVAKLLHAHRADLAGSVKFVFQPAEEGDGGALAMIADGVLQNPRPDIALGMHVMPEKPVGWVGVTSGPVMAASETFRVQIQGKGSHGALPHQSIDPVLAAAQVVTSLQSIVSRNVPALEAAVISVTSIHGGDAYNVIPNAVEIKGTIRTFNSEVRHIVLQRFSPLVNHTVEAFNCKADIRLISLTPAVMNDEKVVQIVQGVVSKILPYCEMETGFRSVVSEDMSYYLQQVPGCFLFIGTGNEEKGIQCTLHHPCFEIDEEALLHGVSILTQVTMDYLNPELIDSSRGISNNILDN